MIKTKDELCNEIKRVNKQNIGNQNLIKNNVKRLKDEFNIPASVSFDILTLKTDPIDETDNVLFALLSVLNDVKITSFFTKTEISTYSKWKFKEEKTNFPIKLKMTEITSTQWIGKITVKELMKFRNSQLINYNENAQRRLKRIISGDEEWYQIDINREAVNGIINSYKQDAYIPNTITLNMPETTDYYYDGEYLVINELTAFDILDGYHRYIAMSDITNLDKKFDYPMELRIVMFSEDIAKQFIWQEDQKTKMHKIDSDALNQYNPANNVVDRLNTKILKQVISRNNGIIDATSISQIIGILWFNTRNKITNSKIIEVRDYIYNKFEVLLDSDSTIFDNKWNYKYLTCALFLFTYDIEDKKLLNEINSLYEIVSQDDYKYIFTGRTCTQQTISRLRKVYEGGK